MLIYYLETLTSTLFGVCTALNGEKMDRKQHQEDWIAG